MKRAKPTFPVHWLTCWIWGQVPAPMNHGFALTGEFEGGINP